MSEVSQVSVLSKVIESDRGKRGEQGKIGEQGKRGEWGEWGKEGEQGDRGKRDDGDEQGEWGEGSEPYDGITASILLPQSQTEGCGVRYQGVGDTPPNWMSRIPNIFLLHQPTASHILNIPDTVGHM